MERTDEARGARGRLLLAGTLLLVLLAQAGLGLFALWRSAEAEADAARRLGATVEALDSLREAQAGFGRQVQEWKNVLLRGGDPEARARHEAAFEAAERGVRDRLGTTAASGLGPTGRMTALMAEHLTLGDAYRAALAGRNLAAPGGAAAADAAVQGADRALARTLDETAGGLAAVYETSAREARAAASARYDATRRSLLLASGAAALAAIALLVLLLRRG